KKAPKEAAPEAMPKPYHGEFMWNELMTRDDNRALEFFKKVIGWTHEDFPMGPDGVYRIAKTHGTDKSVAGMMKMTEPQFPPEVPTHWMSYIAVDDVDKRANLVVAAGGEVIHPPTPIPQVGKFCIIKDPTGAVVALMTPEGGVA